MRLWDRPVPGDFLVCCRLDEVHRCIASVDAAMLSKDISGTSLGSLLEGECVFWRSPGPCACSRGDDLDRHAERASIHGYVWCIHPQAEIAPNVAMGAGWFRMTVLIIPSG